MADISEYIEQIENAVYGEEVRSSIVNSLQAINDEVNKEAYSVTLAAEDWEEDEDGYLVQEIENENVTADSTVLVAMQTVPTGLNLEAAANYSNIYHATVHDGGIKFYILEAAGADVPIDYVLISSKAGKVFLTGSGVGGGGELVLRGINVLRMPNKTRYRKGDSIVKTGLLVKARYNNGSVADVTAQCVFSTETAQSTVGTQTITLTYTENEITTTTTFDIIVFDLASLEVTTLPTKRLYDPGETIDISGIAVSAIYSDGLTQDVTSFITYSPLVAPSSVGNNAISVAYTEEGTEATTTFTVTTRDLGDSIAVTIAGLANGKSAIVTVTDETDSAYTASKTVAQGNTEIICAIPNGHSYTISVAKVSKYNSPEDVIGVAVGNSSHSVTLTFVLAYQPLQSYTWAEINAISLAGKAAEAFELGETKNFTINENGSDVTYVAQIIDFDKKTSTDGSVTYGFVFQTTQCVNNSYLDLSGYTMGGEAHPSFVSALNEIYENINNDLKSVIKNTTWKYIQNINDDGFQNKSFNGRLSIPTLANLGLGTDRYSERYSFYPEMSEPHQWTTDNSEYYLKTTQDNDSVNVNYYVANFKAITNESTSTYNRVSADYIANNTFESGDEAFRVRTFSKQYNSTTQHYEAYITFIFAV